MDEIKEVISSSNLWISYYELKEKSTSAGPGRVHQGALFKVRAKNAFNGEVTEGFADLHPWPELGDLPLKEQLLRLKNGDPTQQTRLTLQWAAVDRDFRARGVSAFKDLTVPNCHWLVMSCKHLNGKELHWIAEQGFDTVKIKIGRTWREDLRILRQMENALTSFRVRLDLNSRLRAPEFLEFTKQLPLELSRKIEFIEDPIAWRQGGWSELGSVRIPLALDRCSDLELEAAEGVPWLIHKPAVQDPTRFFEVASRLRAKVCTTSYLDHPLGQVMAAFVAAKYSPATTAGLLSHFVYEPNDFSVALNCHGPIYFPSSEPGFGFGELLAKCAWQKLDECT